MGSIAKRFGSPPSQSMLNAFEAVNSLPDSAVKRAIEFAMRSTVEAYPTTENERIEFARELGIPERSLVAVVTVCVNLLRPCVDEPVKGKFEQELISVGLEARKARAVSEALYSQRDRIIAQAQPALRSAFGPVLRDVRWRAQRSAASSEPITLDPVGFVSLTLQTVTEAFDESFEVNLKELDELIEALSNLRRELSDLTKH